MLNLAHQRRLHLSKRLRIESPSKAERAEKELKAKSRGAKLRAEEQS